jgi:site-specific recombinase XerD
MCFLETRFGKQLSEIDTNELKIHLHESIIQRKVSTSYINQFISAYKIFVQDVLKKDWENIKIARPRREKKLPVVLSQNEVEKLLVGIKNLKHKAMLMLMYSAGLRLTELLQIKPKAIDSNRMVVHVVQGKGKKDRYTILSEKTLALLRTYYQTYRPSTYLFEPNGSKNKMLSARTLGHIVKQSAAQAGLTKVVSPHTLRHSFATHLMENGINIKQIQEFLGHTSIKTTSIYLHLVTTEMRHIKSPLDGMSV